jgi:phosphate butyryltransferase
MAKKLGWLDPILIGHPRHIRDELHALGQSSPEWEIVEEKDYQEATRIGARLVTAGKADILMRGRLLAREFFATLFEPELELRKSGSLWTNIVAIQLSSIDRLILLTDCALAVDLDLPGRLKLIQNATDFAMFLGIHEPKISLLAAVETVTPGMPVSLEEAVIAKMSERGQFPKGVSVDGPLSLDLSLSAAAVAKKKMKSPVAGVADVLVVDSVNVGNLLFKSFITLCGAQSASVIVGAPIPIILTSRSESPENILNSFALAIMMAGKV